MTDKLGTEITVGCFIAYGHALGRCAGIRIGKVLKIKEGEKREFRPWASTDRITVIGIDDDWSSQEPRLCTRTGTLLYSNRVIVLSTLPEKFMTLLAQA